MIRVLKDTFNSAKNQLDNLNKNAPMIFYTFMIFYYIYEIINKKTQAL